jgi:aminopeptidase-like protein
MIETASSTPWSLSAAQLAEQGERMHALCAQLYPICRSITGDGLRATLNQIGERIPLTLHEIPSGTSVFDWTVPREWNIREAWVKNAAGEKVIDFARHNLHVMSYSVPVHAKLSLAELRPHLHTLVDAPEWIPYRTSYYREDWGFCLAHRDLERLAEGEYEVCIDSTLEPGSLTYGECYLPGTTEDEVLLSCHACHPSLASDNLSGIALVTALAELLATAPRWYSYRILFIPGTIGSITWLWQHEEEATRIKHGLVVANVGDPGAFHYKRSRRGNAAIDRAVAHALKTSQLPHEIRDFSPYGYDERQYCSPGFDLPVGSLTRTPHGKFPQYHTSADNLDFITPAALAGSLAMYLKVLQILEYDCTYLNLNPHCEPQLGKRGLYRSLGGLADAGQRELAMLWVLNQSDGEHSLLEIAERSGLAFELVHDAAQALLAADLLSKATQ